MKKQMHTIKLVALDMDGTLLNEKKELSKRSKSALIQAIEQGVQIIPASGRPLLGIPKEVLSIPGIRYVIAANGAFIYDQVADQILHEDCLDYEKVLEFIHKISQLEVMVDVFIEGMGYVERKNFKKVLDKLENPSVREYLLMTRKPVEDLCAFIKEKQKPIQKITINFTRDENGTLLGKSQVQKEAAPYTEFAVVSGVETNLEITKVSATKGNALLFLAEHLGILPEETMACGDSGNDRQMLLAAGLGVAMEHASREVLEVADFVTKTNDADGVAFAMEQFVLKSPPCKEKEVEDENK